MGWPGIVVLAAVVAGQAADLPAPFPRPGTTSILENDVVAVWNVSWLKQQYPLHTHRYDLVGVSYVEGDRIITQGSGPGRLVNTKAWVFQTNRANVTHVEEGASDPPMRAVLIELKTAAPRAGVADAPDGLRQVAGNSGRMGRSVRRAARMAASDGRASRLMKPPGILPAAYIRSSKSTVSGKKSRPGRGSDRLAVPSTMVSP